MIRFVQASDAAYGAQGLALFKSLQRCMPDKPGSWRMEWYCVDFRGWELAERLRRVVRDSRLAALIAYDNDNDTTHDPRIVDMIPGLRLALGPHTGTPSWFWTWAAQAVHREIENNPEDVIVYLDSDMFALGDLRPAIEEMLASGADVGLVPHRFPPHRKHMEARASWNVGALTTFAPTIRARALASWWAGFVRGRCELHDPGDEYLGIPPGRAGDQAPCDAFGRIARVYEYPAEAGVHIAPWNFDALCLYDGDGGPCFRYQSVGVTGGPIRLANLHEFRFSRDGACAKQTGYPIPPDVRRVLVEPYKEAVREAARELWNA